MFKNSKKIKFLISAVDIYTSKSIFKDYLFQLSHINSQKISIR